MAPFASDVAAAYGLGNPEQTPIYVSAEEAGGSNKVITVPILNITGGKIDRWMNFTRNFKPTR
jgi:hypothetical protein